MSFKELNSEISETQKEFELLILKTIEAEDALDKAKIALVQAESSKKKARLELKLFQEILESLKEQSYNARVEARL